MAEAILKAQKFSDVSVRSKGIAAADGDSASMHVENLLHQHNMWLKHHSGKIQLDDIEWADYVLTMTNQHKQLLQMLFPTFVDRIFTLSELAIEENRDVVDPYGGDGVVYTQTFSELIQLIKNLAKKQQWRKE